MTDLFFISEATLTYFLFLGTIGLVLALLGRLKLGPIEITLPDSRRRNLGVISFVIIIATIIGLLSGGKVEITTGTPSYLAITTLGILLIVGSATIYYLTIKFREQKIDWKSLLESNHVNKSDDMNKPTSQTASFSVLFLAADPADASRLRLGEEFREIQEKLKLAKLRDRFKLELPQLSVRPADISQALLDAQPQIVHFSGHGASTGALCFENQVGQTHLVQPDALAALFEQFAHQVNCVLLNACYSGTQAKAIAEHIKYVIGMNQAIGDKAAIAFAIGFYQALGAGRTIEDAYKLGCVQIGLQGIPEHLIPVLIKNGQAQP